MRTWIIAATVAISTWAFGPAPALALEGCWPQCLFSNSSSSPSAERPSRSRESSRSSSRTSSRSSSKATRTASSNEDRPQRRSSARSARSSKSTISSSYSGGGGGGATGIASFYWQPQRVASGGWFNPNAMTAAHKSLPFGTRVRVTHLGNGRSVEVMINDRGPFVGGRIIDLSKAAAGVIGMQGQGLANVRMDVIGR